MRQPSAERWQFWAGVGFFISVLLLLGWGVWQLNLMLHDRAELPVKKIKVGGQLRYIDSQKVTQALLADGPLPGLGAVDINQLQTKLMAVPWVKWAAVRKSWPDQLDIYLIEHQPVAYWREQGLIDSQAKLFFVPDTQLAGGLPKIDAPQPMIADALQMLREMNRVLGQGKAQIDTIRVTERKAWQVTLDEGLQLRFGRKDTLQRLRRFRGIYPQILAAGKGKPAYMDFRYDTGAAVFWPEQVEPKVDG